MPTTTPLPAPAQPDKKELLDVQLKLTTETYESKRDRILGELEAKYSIELPIDFEGATPQGVAHAQLSYAYRNNPIGGLCRDETQARLNRIACAENLVVKDLTGELRTILDGLPSEEEKEQMLHWMESNLLDRKASDGTVLTQKRSLMNSFDYSSLTSRYPCTEKFQWPGEDDIPATQEQAKLAILPESYLKLITACIKAAILKGIIAYPPDERTEEQLIFLSALEQGGLDLDRGTKGSLGTGMTIGGDGQAYIYLIKPGDASQDEPVFKRFRDEFKSEHPLDTHFAATMALILERITEDRGGLDWGKLNWPKAINLKSGSRGGASVLEMSLPVKKEMDALSLTANSAAIPSLRDQIRDRVKTAIGKGGNIPVTSVPEAQVAVNAVLENARKAIENAETTSGTRETAANTRAITAETRAQTAETKQRQLERVVSALQGELAEKEGVITELRTSLAVANTRETVSRNDAIFRETVSRNAVTAVRNAYLMLRGELEANKGIFKTSARLAAYGEFLKAVLKTFNIAEE